MKDKLKELRCSRNLSQADLAQELGVSRSCISSWERGTRRPDTRHILMYYRFFNLENGFFGTNKIDKKFEQRQCFDISLLNCKGVNKLFEFYQTLLQNEEYLKKT